MGRKAALADADEKQQGFDIVVSRPDVTPMMRRPRRRTFAGCIVTMSRCSTSFHTSMPFALGFIFGFAIGDFWYPIPETVPINIQRQDTYHMVAHFQHVPCARSSFVYGRKRHSLLAGDVRYYSKPLELKTAYADGRRHRVAKRTVTQRRNHPPPDYACVQISTAPASHIFWCGKGRAATVSKRTAFSLLIELTYTKPFSAVEWVRDVACIHM